MAYNVGSQYLLWQCFTARCSRADICSPGFAFFSRTPEHFLLIPLFCCWFMVWFFVVLRKHYHVHVHVYLGSINECSFELH